MESALHDKEASWIRKHTYVIRRDPNEKVYLHNKESFRLKFVSF